MDLDPRRVTRVALSDATGQDRIVGIQMLRLLAAFAVLFSHAYLIAYHTGRFMGVDPVRQEWPQKGTFGVDLFFVISGFIMVHSSARLPLRSDGITGARRTFLHRRLARIVPLYWAGTLVMIAWLAKYGPRPDLADVVMSLLFVPFASSAGTGRITPLLDVGWTLNFEMLFYLLFAATLALKPEATVARLATVLAGLVAIGTAVALPLPWWFWTRPILLEFAAGMAIALLAARGVALPLAVRLAMAGLAALLVMVGVIDAGPAMTGWGRVVTCGAAGSLVVAATVLGPLRLRHPGMWNRGGDISYALYLVHIPLMLALQMVWRHFRLPYGPMIEIGFIVLVCGLSFIAAGLVHDLFERPVTRWLNARFAR